MNRTTHAIPCTDGFILRANLFGQPDRARALVLLHPATAVTERMYAAFASHLADQGFLALTYNYRGMQAGTPAKAVKAGFSTWAEFDVEAVTRWAAGEFPDLPLFAVGHSFGGHAIGLCDSSRLLSGAVLIASQAGCLRFIRPTTERLRVAALLKVIGPFCARVMGYVPGRRLGIGEDLPAQVMLEWSRWTSLPNYFFDDPTMHAAERFRRPCMPLLSIGFDDDPWAPADAIDLMSGRLANCRVERRQYGPADSHGQAIGHLGFFRDRHATTLWPQVCDWLARRVEERA
ncbi:alpha/beta hydrolase family protein [Pseudomonas japonica]|uniref:Predicted alpha/beta hydrolase n=1 Tax=Pseudomonas japonica TaxID=256466 RepID=A0A239LQI6_9PSED|nr:alpha/beta fold hydrolase [Pseudomonas japonica]SNT32128.1 Predicted alpha/beta hydrolase [Pseudomonas japonica]